MSLLSELLFHCVYADSEPGLCHFNVFHILLYHSNLSSWRNDNEVISFISVVPADAWRQTETSSTKDFLLANNDTMFTAYYRKWTHSNRFILLHGLEPFFVPSVSVMSYPSDQFPGVSLTLFSHLCQPLPCPILCDVSPSRESTSSLSCPALVNHSQ